MATITVNELATALETTPRTARKFLRSADSGVESVGKGSRYAIEKRTVRALRTRFNRWDEARNAPKGDEGDNSDNSDTTDDE